MRFSASLAASVIVAVLGSSAAHLHPDLGSESHDSELHEHEHEH